MSADANAEYLASGVCVALAGRGFEDDALEAAAALVLEGDEDALRAACVLCSIDFPEGQEMDDDPPRRGKRTVALITCASTPSPLVRRAIYFFLPCPIM